MSNKICDGCIYEKYKDELTMKGYVEWGSSEPYPCINCERLPHKAIDNYRHYIMP